MITRFNVSQLAAVREALHVTALREAVRALLDAVLPPEDDRAFYGALAARREPVFRDFAVVSPWAGRRRAARRHEAA
jgi:hypothetical protein